MRSPRTRLVPCLAAFALLLASGSGSASVPIGGYEFQLGGVNSLWMGDSQSSLGDEEGFCADFGAGFDIVASCHFELSVDGRGRIGGSAGFAGFKGGRYVALEGPVKGAQRGDNRSGVTKAAFQIRLLGATVQGTERSGMRVTFKFAGQIDAAGQRSGLWTQRFCIEGAGCTTTRTPAAPATWTNGHWTLSLGVDDGIVEFFNDPRFGWGTSASLFFGRNARIRFGDDSVCDFAVSGRGDGQTGVANLVLTPISEKCKGGWLRLRSLTRIAGASEDTLVGELQYSLFGVRGVTVVDTTAPSDYRVLLEHYLDPLDNPLPQNPGQGTPLPSGGAGSTSSGAVMVVTIIDWHPPQPAPTQGASISATEIQANTASYQEMFDFTTYAAPATLVQSSATPAALDLSVMEDSVLLQPYTFTLGQGAGPTYTILLQPGVDPFAP